MTKVALDKGYRLNGLVFAHAQDYLERVGQKLKQRTIERLCDTDRLCVFLAAVALALKWVEDESDCFTKEVVREAHRLPSESALRPHLFSTKVCEHWQLYILIRLNWTLRMATTDLLLYTRASFDYHNGGLFPPRTPLGSAGSLK
jgi:hypothetical protein